MKGAPLWTALALLACGETTPPAPTPAVPPAAGGPSVRIVFQSNGEGEIEPCG